MPLLPELDSPLPSPIWAPSRRQFPNGPPENANPGGVATATQTSATNSYTASLVPVATTATYSAVNTRSLVFDPTADSRATAAATPTESTSDPIDQSIVEKLFTPSGGLFAVGVIIFSLAVLALITCAIVIIRCTLRSRRRSRMRSRAQSFTEKNVSRRQMSSDRASDFWSAGANESLHGRTTSGDNVAGEADVVRNGQPPPRPVRSGETEVDLRAPGRIHFAPSAMMSDQSRLSTHVQLHGSGGNMDSNPPNRQTGRRTPANAYTLDQDPFAASPIVPMPTITSPHATSAPYVSNTSQFAANSNSSPSNITSSPSETAVLGSSFGSANMLGLTSSPSSPYIPRDTTAPLATPTSGAMYRDTMMSDPFAYDNMVRSRAPTLGETPGAAPLPSPGVTWANMNAGIASPPALYISRTSPGIQTGSHASPNSLSGSPAMSPAFAQAPLLSPNLQSDVSHALSLLQRRMSASTVATRFSQQTEYQYRPPVSDDERSFGYFMHGSPGGVQRSLSSVPRLKVSTPSAPETLQMQPTNIKSKALEYGSPMYASALSVYDKYYQDSENSSRSRSGTRS